MVVAMPWRATSGGTELVSIMRRSDGEDALLVGPLGLRLCPRLRSLPTGVPGAAGPSPGQPNVPSKSFKTQIADIVQGTLQLAACPGASQLLELQGCVWPRAWPPITLTMAAPSAGRDSQVTP